MPRIIIAGGPHTGKTSLLNGLREAFPHAGFVPEPATSVLEATGDYSLLEDPLRFCSACMQFSIEAEAKVDNNNLVIQDRSLIDTIAYARRDNCESLIPRLRQSIAIAGYSLALECDFVGEYQATETRTEDREMAATTHTMIMQAYRELEIPTIQIPALALEERVALAAQQILDYTMTENTYA